MTRAAVVFTYRPDGSGTLFVHRRRGTWRKITFTRLLDVVGRLGAATTTVLPGLLLVAQAATGPALHSPRISRAGPAVSPITPNAP